MEFKEFTDVLGTARRMESTTESPAAQRRRGFLARILAALVIAAGMVKAIAFVAVDYMRGLAVNPFEGFGLTQFAVAGASMALSIAAYATKAPLPLVIGFVLIVVVHEIGHAVVIRAKGLRAGVMVFIPFIGGAVTLKDQPRSAYDDAQIGLAGPIAGTAASLIVLQIYKWTDSPLYLAIAAAGFAVYAIAGSYTAVIAGAALRAIGGSLLWPAATAWISESAPHRRHALAMGIFGEFENLGVTLGPVAGGLAWSAAGIQAAFFTYAVTAVLVAVVSAIAVSGRVRAPGPVGAIEA